MQAISPWVRPVPRPAFAAEAAFVVRWRWNWLLAAVFGALTFANVLRFAPPLPFPFPSRVEPDVTISAVEPVVLDAEQPRLLIRSRLPSDRRPAIEISRIELRNARQEKVEAGFEVASAERGAVIALDRPAAYQPGSYDVSVVAVVNGKPTVLSASFRWGVVAFNVRQAEQRPRTLQELHLAVLDDYGRTECNADVTVRVTDPLGVRTTFRTRERTVVRNPACRDRSVTNEPDYRVYYSGQVSGAYRVEVRARTKDGTRQVSDAFVLSESIPVKIERAAFPTRIYPPASYPVRFTVAPGDAFHGRVIERVPASFVISDVSNGGVVRAEDGDQIIEWSVDWAADSTHSLGYTFKAPDISPELYRLGPLEFAGENGAPAYVERRGWQIAADATKTWDGGGTTSAWSECANWNLDTCPANTGDAIVFNGTSNDASDWDSGSSVTSVASLSITSMSGDFTISKTPVTVAGAFTHSSTGNVIFSGSLALSVAGNFTLTTSGSFTPNSSTLTMTGTSNDLDTSKTLYNLTINAPVGGTVTTRNNSFTVSNALVVNDTFDVLTIGAGLSVTHTGGTFTLGGSIGGTGTLIFTNTSPGPGSGGSMNAPVRYDASNGDIASTTFDARTYANRVEFYSNSGTARTVTFATGTYALSGASSHFYVIADGTNSLTVTGATNDPTVTIGGDLDFTGTGGGSEAINTGGSVANTWTVSGSANFTDGTVTVETGNTFKMDGVGKTLTGAGQTLYNLNIDPSSTGTITVSTSDLTVSNTVTVAANDTLSIDNGRTLTSSLTSGSALTLNGTISGSGTYVYSTSTTFPTSGTISAYLRINMTGANASVPARTFGGTLEIYTSASVNRTATLGTGISQTITISGSFYLTAAGTNLMLASGALNTPTMSISGSVDFIGTGSGSERIITGAGAWTVGGDFDLRDGGVFTATSGNVVTMTGTSNTIYGSTRTFYDLTIDPASTGTITESGGLGVSNTLTVAADDTFSTSDYLDLTKSSGTSLVLNGTISGAGYLYYYSTAAFPTTGTISSVVYFYAVVDMSVPGRTFGGDIWIEADNTVLQTVTFGSAGGQTVTINGQLKISALSTANVVLDAATYDPTVSIGTDLDFIGTGSGTEVINAGTGTWTVSGNVDFTGGQYNVESGNTLVMNGTTKTLTSASQTLGNLTLSGSITLANATHTVSGNFSMAGGAITAGSSTVTMTGTSKTITGGGNTLSSLTIDPATASTITLQTSDLTVSSTLTVAAGDTLSIDASRTLSHTGATLTWGDGTSTISGSGTLRFTDASGGPGSGGVLSAVTRYDASSADIASTTFDARTYGGKVELYANSGTAKSISCADASTYTISGAASHLLLYAAGAGGLSLLCDTATDPTVTIGGNVDYQGLGDGSESMTTGAGSWTVSGNVDLTDGTLAATSGNVFTMNGTGGKTLTCNSQTFYDLTVDPTSSATITLQTSDCTVSNTLTIATDDTLSVSSNLSLILSRTSGTSLTLNGILSGTGWVLYRSSTTFPSTGTISANLAFDATYGDQTMPDRNGGTDYGGDVWAYSADGSNHRTVTMSAGTIAIAGELAVVSDNVMNITLTGATNSPTVTVGGNLTMYDLGGGTPGIVGGSGTWTVSGDVDLTVGTFTAPTTFQMNGNSTLLTSAGKSFTNFAVTGGSVANNDAADINGTFAVSSGSFTASASVNMNVAGNFSITNGTTFTGPTGAGKLIFDGDLTLTDSTASKQNLGNVQIGTSPDTTNLASDIAPKSLTVTAGDFFYTNGYDIDTTAVTISGTFDATDDVELDETTINDSGNFTINSGATFVADQSTLIMDGTSGTVDIVTDGAFSLYNLTLSDGGGSLTVEVEDPLDVDGNLTITGGTLDAKNGESNQINVGGNWDNDDGFQARSGTVVFDAGSGTKTIDADGTGTDAFYSLTFNDAAGTATYQLTTALDVDWNLTITGGNFDANGNAINVGGNWDNDDTFTSGTQTTTFDASAGTKTIDADGTGTDSFSTVVFNDAGGGATWQLTADMDVNSNLTITGGTLDFNGSNTLYVNGNFTNSDTIVQSTGTLVMDGASGTKTIDTTEALSNTASDFNNITFNDGGGPATYTTNYPLDLDANLTITGGTLDLTGPTTWYLTNSNYNAVAGNWRLKVTDPAGTADDTTICDDLNAGVEGNCVLVPGQTDTDFTTDTPSAITETGWMLSNGNTVNGTIAAGNWTVNATVMYTVGDCSYNKRYLKARLWKVTADFGSATALTSWTSSGLLSTGTNDYTITFSSVPAQTLSNEVLYAEFVGFLGEGMCAPGASTTVKLRVNEGGTKQKLNTPAFTPQVNVAGNWDNNDTFTHANGTVVFDAGATGKTIEAGASSFYNATVNNASGGWTVQTDNLTVANNLTLTAGSAWTVASGRTLEVQGNYSQSIAGANTTWTGSTLYLNGSGGMYDIKSKTHGGDTYATLRIGASEDISDWDSSASSYTIDAGGCLFSQDHGGTSGRLNVYGTCNSRANEYWSYATDFDGTALGGSSRQADVRFASGASLTADNGDTLQVLGQSAGANRTLVSRQSAGNYALTVDGTINAQYYDFDYLDQNGLNITGTATVSELSDGTFDNAGAGASSSYVSVTSATTNKDFFRNVFDDSGDGTDASVVYNVNASGSGIVWTFFDWSGNRAGEDYDVDAAGAFVGWQNSLSLSVSATSVDLGQLDPYNVASVGHTITVTTTAANGYTCSVVEDGNLRNGAYDIDDVVDGSVSAGSEEYGISCSGGGCAFGDDRSISGAPRTIASSVGSVTNQTTTITYKAAVTSATTAVDYSHVVTFTCTADF